MKAASHSFGAAPNKLIPDALIPSDRVQSLLLALLFVLTAIANGLVSSGVSVPLDNVVIADAHPTYLVPSGYAFSIWGIIYALVGVFSLLQALPAQLKDEHYRRVRPWAGLSLLTNILWLYLFSFEMYWVSLLVIGVYAYALLMALESFDVDYLDAGQTWQRKLGSCAFSANAAWVVVATNLQFGGNLLDEGWQPSADFCTGVLFIVTLYACFNVFRRADVLYAFVSAWALGGIINNQGEGSDFGTAKKICNAKCVEIMNICSPSGLYSFCQDFDAEDEATPDRQVVPKSPEVVSFCYVCLALVVTALLAGLVRGLVTRRSARRPDTNDSEMVLGASKLPLQDDPEPATAMDVEEPATVL